MPDPAPPLPVQLGLHDALARHTGFLLSRTGMLAQRAFAERMAQIGLTPRAWGALSVLENEGVTTQQALGRCVGMDPSSMVSIIDELEAEGLVERRRNPQDRRAHALHITAKGRRTHKKGREIAGRLQDDFLAPLSADERQQLHELLFRLAQGAAQASAATSSERAAAG